MPWGVLRRGAGSRTGAPFTHEPPVSPQTRSVASDSSNLASATIVGLATAILIASTAFFCPPKPATPRVGDDVRRAYAALELPVGSDFEAVRKAYRALMRKYHPDRHTATPEKQKAATELAQKLTHAYAILEKHLRG